MNYKPYDDTLARIKRNMDIVASGGRIGIPYPFRALNAEIAGIQEGEVHIVTAGTGISKSKYTRFTYIYNVYKYYLETGYRIKLFYFPLEDSEELIVLHLMVFRLYELHGIRVDIKDLTSKTGQLDPAIFKQLENTREYFGKLFEILTIYTDVSTPEGIFNIAVGWAAQLGTIIRNDDKMIVGYERFARTPHTIFIIDNLSNVTIGNYNKDQHSAIGDLAREKVRKVMSKLFQFTVVMDAQQDLANDRAQYDNRGEVVLNKLMPTINGLATNKEVGRDVHIMFGIFAPHRYGVEEWPKSKNKDDPKGYDIKFMGNYFRQLQILKNNEGLTDFRVPLYFDGQIEVFEDLPNYTDTRRLELVYDKIARIREEKKQKQQFLFR